MLRCVLPKVFWTFYASAFKPADQKQDGGGLACRVIHWRLYSGAIWVHRTYSFPFGWAWIHPHCSTRGGVKHSNSGAGGPETQTAVHLCIYGPIYIFSKANIVLGRAEPWADTRTEVQSTQPQTPDCSGLCGSKPWWLRALGSARAQGFFA